MGSSTSLSLTEKGSRQIMQFKGCDCRSESLFKWAAESLPLLETRKSKLVFFVSIRTTRGSVRSGGDEEPASSS